MVDENIELSRRKILGGIATIGAAGAATGAGTIAMWSDEVQLGGDAASTVSTGDVSLGDTTALTIDNTDNLAPGDTFSGTAQVKYTGSLKADLYMSMSLSESGDEPTDDSTDKTAKEFADQIQLVGNADSDDDGIADQNMIKLYKGGVSQYADTLEAVNGPGGTYANLDKLDASDLGALHEQINGLSGAYIDDAVEYGPLEQGDVVDINVYGKVPKDIDPAFQNESVEVTVTFTAKQNANTTTTSS